MRAPMHRMILTLIAVLFVSLAGGAAPPALAHKADFLMYRPYAIEKTCNGHYKHCKVRMIYSPGQNVGIARVGSYWYQNSPGARTHGDFKLRSHKSHAHKAHAKHRKSYHHHCRRTGWGFNTSSLSFAGGIPKRARCIPAYDLQ
jgi:hypothetical protein